MWKEGEEEVVLRKDILSVTQDRKGMDVCDEMMTDRGEWKEKTCCANLK
jgi:hypothetical protein